MKVSGILFLTIVISLAARTYPARAQADPEAAKAAAKAKLVKGSLYLDAGSYARALAEFEDAYKVFPSPKIFFNIGLANVRLGRFPEALRAFDRFLIEATEADPSTIAQARTQADLARPKVGVIEVLCPREGVEIALDDHVVGRTPLDEALYVSPGSHRLTARSADPEAVPLVRTLDVAGGARQKVEVPGSPPDLARPLVPAGSAAKATALSTPSLPAPAPPPARVAAPVSLAIHAPAPRPVSAPADDRPLHSRPWFWGVAGAVVVAAGVTLWLTVGRSTHDPETSLGRMNLPAAQSP